MRLSQDDERVNNVLFLTDSMVFDLGTYTRCAPPSIACGLKRSEKTKRPLLSWRFVRYSFELALILP